MSLRAQLDLEPGKGERRSSRRRKLRLESEPIAAKAGQVSVVIHDLSEDGLLVETSSPLSIGEMIDVVLPEADSAQAEVAWTSGSFFGCRFLRPISTAAVSASLLRSPGPIEQHSVEMVEKALQELEALSFAIKRVTKAVDHAIDRFTKK